MVIMREIDLVHYLVTPDKVVFYSGALRFPDCRGLPLSFSWNISVHPGRLPQVMGEYALTNPYFGPGITSHEASS